MRLLYYLHTYWCQRTVYISTILPLTRKERKQSGVFFTKIRNVNRCLAYNVKATNIEKTIAEHIIQIHITLRYNFQWLFSARLSNWDTKCVAVIQGFHLISKTTKQSHHCNYPMLILCRFTRIICCYLKKAKWIRLFLVEVVYRVVYFWDSVKLPITRRLYLLNEFNLFYVWCDKSFFSPEIYWNRWYALDRRRESLHFP